MTYGGSEFIKMIQKNNKIIYIYIYLCWRGQDKPAWTACPPGGEGNQGGSQDIPGQLVPRGASCPGGKINWDTGVPVYLAPWTACPPPWLSSPPGGASYPGRFILPPAQHK